MKKEWLGFGLALCVLATIAGAAGAVPKNHPLAATDVRGAGSWKPDGGVRVRQQWHLRLRRGEDGWVRGRIRIEGSPYVEDGLVEGRIAGDAIVGTITAESGETVARFKGSVVGNGMAGTYTAVDGEVGEWSWAGEAEK